MDGDGEHHAEALKFRRTASMVEYLLLVGLITVVAITCAMSFGQSIGNRFEIIAAAL